MDKNTFGTGKAPELLATLLDTKYPNLRRRVSANLEGYNRGMRILFYSIKDASLLRNILGLYRKQQIEKVDKMTIPEELKSFVKNVGSIQFKLYDRIAIKWINDKARQSKKNKTVSS
jgi:hypothetical protein